MILLGTDVDISIIVPVYNAREWIRTCVDSALKAYSGSLEVVCVDDGSTDGSGEILDELSAQNEGVRVIHQRNQGRSAARNAGICCARGTWIGFLDADDKMIPGALDVVMRRISNCGDLICFLAEKSTPQAIDRFAHGSPNDAECEVAQLDAGAALCFLSDPAYYRIHDDMCNKAPGLFSAFDALWCWTVFTKLFRASALKGRVCFEDGLKFGEDVLFVHEFLMRNAANVQFVPIATHIYNVDNAGTTRGYSLGDCCKLLDSFEAFGRRYAHSPFPEELDWRCVTDMLFASVRALKYCSPDVAKQEIAQAFYDERVRRACQRLPERRLRCMGSICWVIWLSGFRALKNGSIGAYVRWMRLMAWLERVTERLL